MRLQKIIIVLGFVLAFCLGAFWSQGVFDDKALAQTGTKVVSLDEKKVSDTAVVACTPLQYFTENEEDPFNSERVRRTYTTVTSIVIVHEDGSTEVKKVSDK